MRHHFLSVVFLLLCSALPGRQNQSEVGGGEAISNDEYLVYAAAIDWFVHRGLASQPLVADHTSTFSCATVCNGMKIGGCNGLRGDDESVEERMKITKRDLPQLSADSAQKFVAKNQRCSLIEQKIPTKTGYAIFGTTEPRSSPDGWDHPDYLFFSRVGFDAGRLRRYSMSDSCPAPMQRRAMDTIFFW